MCHSARVLNYSAGNLSAKLLFIGEAPGRLGADETEVPFHGDKSGRNFEDLLSFAGITRNDVFVTNAVLCNPKDKDGNNATPTSAEAANCQPFLKRQIELVNPAIVATLGNTALRALAGIENHSLTLGQHVRTIHAWLGRWLIPLYHPGQRAMLHRSFANQRSDYQFVAEQWHRLTQTQRASSGTTRSDVMALARYLLANRGAVSYFELHKLAYLAEYLHVRKSGRRLTAAYFIRQKDGPYCTDLQIDRLRRADGSIRIFTEHGKLCLRLGKDQTPQLFAAQSEISDEAKAAADEAMRRYGDKDDAELKTAVYLTAPMRFLLRREQSAKSNLYNSPIDFLAAT
jgi:uracil-DNA glycosylase family 4